MKAIIRGSGTSLPQRVVPNEELAPRLGLSPAQIVKSSGIQQRHWVSSGESTGSLAAEALRLALDDASIKAAEIDYLLFGTMTPDRFIPGTGPAVQNAVGLPEIPCLDIRAACCNALYALQLARALISSGAARNVAICLADAQSPFLDLSPQSGSVSMLFGDGASALIVCTEEVAPAGPTSHRGVEVIDVLLASNGQYIDDLGIRCPGSEFGIASTHSASEHSADYAPRMNGQSVILQASRRMVSASKALLERNHLTVANVSWIVPHQANANLLAQVARGLGISSPCEVVSVLEDSGNTSSASMGIALDKLRRTQTVKAGDYLLLPGFAAGFTWGAGLCRALDD